jgi:hypothetical protein
MGVAFSFAAVALAGTAFMMRFLVALLRECMPSKFITTGRLRSPVKAVKGTWDGNVQRGISRTRGVCQVELMRTEHLEKQPSPVLAPLDLRFIPGLDGRPVPSNRRLAFQKHRSNAFWEELS